MSDLRNVESMKELLQYAKLDSSFSCDHYQAITFHPNLSLDDYKLFEIPNNLLGQISKPGSTILELKDEQKLNGSGRVFACTNDETFSLVEAETSNTLLLVSNWWLPSSSTAPPKDINETTLVVPIIEAMKNNYYELQPCTVPSLKQLRHLLLPSTYFGPVEDQDDFESKENERSKYFSREQIHSLLPCSENELIRAFRRLRVCEVDGFVRLIDPEYLTQVIRDLFALADVNAWDWRNQGFPLHACLEGLSDIHAGSLIKQILTLLFARRKHVTHKDSHDIYIFPRNSKICQIVGEHLLSVTNTFDLNDFLALWKATVPSGLRPKLRRHLTCSGRAFCPYNSSTYKIESDALNPYRFRSLSLLRSEDLPDESIDARLTSLFERCSTWPEPELASYLVDLCTLPTKNANLASGSDENSGFNPTATVAFASSDSESDFDYADADTDLPELSPTVADTPKPVPSHIGSLLIKYCRVSSTPVGRICTEKHGR